MFANTLILRRFYPRPFLFESIVHHVRFWELRYVLAEASECANANIAHQELADKVTAELAIVRQWYGEIESRMSRS